MLVFHGKVLPPLRSVQQRVIKPPERVTAPFPIPVLHSLLEESALRSRSLWKVPPTVEGRIPLILNV